MLRSISAFGLLLTILLGTFALLGVYGCSSPCEDFAEIACKTAGANSPECTKARAFAQDAPSEEQRLCTQALKLARSLKQN